jgi:hypothetical protein
MSQSEHPPFLADQLMMGPDGAVHVVPAGTAAVSPPGEMEVQPTAVQHASASDRVHLPVDVAEHDTGLPGVRRVPAVGVCFSYSVGMPPTDGEPARRALQGIRRAPDGGVCFSYSAPMPLTDRDAARQALRDIRRMPQTGVCFSY